MDHENYGFEDPPEREHPNGLKVGDRVRFPEGTGVIMSLEGNKVHVRLDNDVMRWGLIVAPRESIYGVDISKVERYSGI